MTKVSNCALVTPDTIEFTVNSVTILDERPAAVAMSSRIVQGAGEAGFTLMNLPYSKLTWI